MSNVFYDKRGMEMWMLVMIILSLVLLFFIIAWYTGLGDQLGKMVNKVSDLL